MSGETLWVLVLVYATVAAVVMGCCAFDARASSTYAEERRLARYALAAPVWPLVLLWALGRGVRWLWRAAEIGGESRG